MAQSWQDYISWMAAGAPGSSQWWSQAGADAAEAAGVPFYHPDYTAGLWTSRTTPWGENVLYNQQGQAVSWVNPAWETWVRNWMAQNPAPSTTGSSTGGATTSLASAPAAAAPTFSPMLLRPPTAPTVQQPSVNTVAAPAGGSTLMAAQRSRNAMLNQLRRSIY